jgi:outer membrane protein OmpA-like peptidoglycan-associated protein
MKRIFLLAPLALIVSACAAHRPAPPFAATEIQPLPPASQHATPAPNVAKPPSHVASVGPLSPTKVSVYMDGQEADLRQHLRAYGVNIARRGDDMVMNINNAVLFNGMALSTQGNNLLVALSTVLRRFDRSAVFISGYTDTTGSPAQNMAASQKRAQLIANALAKDGVAQARLNAQGFGENNLKIRTGDHVAEQRNRRIEIRVTATPVG